MAELEGNLAHHHDGFHHGGPDHGVLRGGRFRSAVWRVFPDWRAEDLMSEAGTKPHADAKWYIVHTYSNFEKKVSEEIRRQAKLQDLEDYIADVIVPTEDVIEGRGGNTVNSERKFLPGYVLLHAKLT